LHGVQGVGGSNPLAPTNRIKGLVSNNQALFLFLALTIPPRYHRVGSVEAAMLPALSECCG